MLMLAEPNGKIEDRPLDAVVGGDTHRDTHTLFMLSVAGVVITQIVIGNNADGFARALAWIADNAPGPNVLVGWRAAAATVSGCAGRCRPPAW